MKVYTKTGDKGMTSLIGGERVFKTDERVEAYGSVDELAAFTALLADNMRGDAALAPSVGDLNRILSRLMSVEALLATGQSGSDKVAPLDPETVAWLEGRIDAMQEVLKPIDKFTIPGGNAVVSMCHVCRTVCRRAERAALRADARYGVDSTALVWLNRLDDLTILSIQCPFIKNPGRIILIIYHFKCADFSIFQHFQHKLCMNRHPRCTEIPVRFFFCSVTILIVRNGLFRNLIINLCSL